MKEEVAFIQRKAVAVPRELPPQGRGSLPLHQPVPGGASGPQTRLGCAGSPAEGGMRLPGALQAPRAAVAQLVGTWPCPGSAGTSRRFGDRMGTVPPHPLACAVRPSPSPREPPGMGHTEPLALRFVSTTKCLKCICSQEGAAVICSVSHILPWLLF